MQDIGVVGLGNMGGRIAKRLLNKGYRLHVFDANEQLVESFQTLGAIAEESLMELAVNCHFVMTVLPNAQVVKQVVLDEKGLIAGLKPGSVLIDITSSVPETTREIGGILAQKDIKMIDAPVSGGLKRAEDGTLTVMVGGAESAFSESQTVLKEIGSNIVHVGELGAGHAIKALNNLISATTFAITAEALAIGVKMGLKPSKMLEVINSSTGKNNSSENKFPQYVLTRKFNVGFSLDLMYKDLSIATDLAREAKVPSFVASTVFQLWQQAQLKGNKNTDHSEFAKLIEEMAGVEIVD
ncbi:MAG TPA: NAD(P)-dependent oxidoreductase [Bacillales bacterium]|nr:NAD(P)-dependent oxidoreductase [Bacillales bacterium]